MDALLQPMRAAGDERRHFLATYMRTTLAVKAEIEQGRFVDDGGPSGGTSRSRQRTPSRAYLRSATCCSA
jgi:hypothetical protein